VKAGFYVFAALLSLAGVASATTPFGMADMDPVAAQHSPADQPAVVAIVENSVDLAAELDGKYVVLTNSDEAAEWCDCCTLDCPTLWTVRVGAVILDRSKPEGDVLARPLGGLLSVSAGGDFDFGWEGGVDVYLARQFASGLGVEMRYFGVDSNASFDYGDTGDVRIGHTTVVNLFDVDAAYSAQLHSTEINLQMPGSERVTWLAGFR